MEIFYFTIGMLTVLFTVGVLGIFMVWKKVTNVTKRMFSLKETTNSIANDLAKQIDMIYCRIDDESKKLSNDCSFIEEKSVNTTKEIYRTMDSRLDKLEKKLKKIFEEGCKPAQEK